MSYGRVADAIKVWAVRCGVCGRNTFDEFNIPILETGGSYLCECCMKWADDETEAMLRRAQEVKEPRDRFHQAFCLLTAHYQDGMKFMNAIP